MSQRLGSGKPLVSVIINVFNRERYISRAIKSILSQSINDLELIIVDDGSTDRSRDIIHSYSSRDERIIVHFNPQNYGIPKTLNIGLSLCRGKYMARLDSDDISEQERLAKQVDFLEKKPDYCAVGSEIILTDPEGWPLSRGNHYLKHEEIESRLLLGDGSAITHSTLMTRSSILRAVGGYDEEFVTCEDLDLYLRLAECGRLANLSDVLVKWRQHPKSENFQKYDTWKNYKTLALQKAGQRRGVHIDTEFIVDRTMNKKDIRFFWAKRAFYEGYIHTSFKNLCLSMLTFGIQRKHLSLIKKMALDNSTRKG